MIPLEPDANKRRDSALSKPYTSPGVTTVRWCDDGNVNELGLAVRLVRSFCEVAIDTGSFPQACGIWLYQMIQQRGRMVAA
jgi:hypothetical protein